MRNSFDGLLALLSRHCQGSTLENNTIKYIPNIITVFRFVLIFPFLISICGNIVHNYTNPFPLILFIAIIVSDVLDGYLARKLNFITILGAKLDIITDAIYSISSLFLFAYLKVIPIWFPVILGIKLLEFSITSKIIKIKYRSSKHIIFDRSGKMAVNIAMLLPGIFIFRCIITEYKIIMNILAYFVTVLIVISFFHRMVLALKPNK